MTPYEQCISFYRKWAADYHMTPAQIDDADLELLLDMEVLDSKIDAEAESQRGKKNDKKVFIDQIL
ncbi:MAG: hypothetical protein IJP68_12305 [Selenomonadaceae bacterium]|nr:hypothetical protein [Selenomonadaceae bacterium]